MSGTNDATQEQMQMQTLIQQQTAQMQQQAQQHAEQMQALIQQQAQQQAAQMQQQAQQHAEQMQQQAQQHEQQMQQMQAQMQQQAQQQAEQMQQQTQVQQQSLQQHAEQMRQQEIDNALTTNSQLAKIKPYPIPLEKGFIYPPDNLEKCHPIFYIIHMQAASSKYQELQKQQITKLITQNAQDQTIYCFRSAYSNHTFTLLGFIDLFITHNINDKDKHQHYLEIKSIVAENIFAYTPTHEDALIAKITADNQLAELDNKDSKDEEPTSNTLQHLKIIKKLQSISPKNAAWFIWHYLTHMETYSQLNGQNPADTSSFIELLEKITEPVTLDAQQPSQLIKLALNKLKLPENSESWNKLIEKLSNKNSAYQDLLIQAIDQLAELKDDDKFKLIVGIIPNKNLIPTQGHSNHPGYDYLEKLAPKLNQLTRPQITAILQKLFTPGQIISTYYLSYLFQLLVNPTKSQSMEDYNAKCQFIKEQLEVNHPEQKDAIQTIFNLSQFCHDQSKRTKLIEGGFDLYEIPQDIGEFQPYPKHLEEPYKEESDLNALYKGILKGTQKFDRSTLEPSTYHKNLDHQDGLAELLKDSAKSTQVLSWLHKTTSGEVTGQKPDFELGTGQKLIEIIVNDAKNKPTDIPNKLTANSNLENLDSGKVSMLCDYLWQHKDAKSSGDPTEAITTLKASLPKAASEPLFAAFLKKLNNAKETTKQQENQGQELQYMTPAPAPAPAPAPS